MRAKWRKKRVRRLKRKRRKTRARRYVTTPHIGNSHSFSSSTELTVVCPIASKHTTSTRSTLPPPLQLVSKAPHTHFQWSPATYPQYRTDMHDYIYPEAREGLVVCRGRIAGENGDGSISLSSRKWLFLHIQCCMIEWSWNEGLSTTA